MILNKAHIAKSEKLTVAQRAYFAEFTEEQLVIVASVLHGARISASSHREKRFKAKLQAKYGSLAEQWKGEWDFGIRELNLAIDLKSPGFDHNTPVASWVQKYSKALPANFTGIFVIQELPNMPLTLHWPTAAIEAFGFRVMSETQFEKEYL
jgi:hypothetical protein